MFRKSCPEFVTVVMPFHEINKNFELALKSILKSKHVRVDILLLDDRTEPKESDEQVLIKLLRLIELSKHSVRIHKTSKHGYANALNESRLKPTAEFVALMNSDDLVSKNRFFNQIQNLKKGTDVEICRIVKFKGVFPVPSILGSIRGSYSPELLLLGAYGADATICCRREIWVEKFSYNESVNMSDWEMALRNFHKLNVGISKNARYYYRMHKNQASRTVAGVSGRFTEIFSAWENLSQALCLPSLTITESAQIATPWQRGLNQSEISQQAVRTWLIEFSKLPSVIHSTELKSLLRRRYAVLWILGFRYKFFFISTLKVVASYLISRLLGASRGV